MKIWSVGKHPGVIKYSFYMYDENGERKSVSSVNVKKKCEANRDTITKIVGGSLIIAAAFVAPPLLAAAAGYGAVTNITDLIIAAQKAA